MEMTAEIRVTAAAEEELREKLQEWAKKAVPLRQAVTDKERRVRASSVNTISPTRSRSVSVAQSSEQQSGG